jgi:cyanophycin synthetase
MTGVDSRSIAPAALRASELRVTRLRALRGPNYWRLAPVIACDVELGALEEVDTAGLPGFVERLLELLPSLHDHECSHGREGGFVEQLREGTKLPHVIEHVALELQVLAGCDVGFGRVVASGDPAVWWVMVAYEEEEVGIQAMRRAIDLIRACIDGEPVDMSRTQRQLRELYEAVRLGPSTAAVIEEARRRGIPVRRLNSRSLVRLGLGRNLRRIQATVSDFTSAIGVEIAQNKDETKRALEQVGLPVPRGEVARTEEEAVEIAAEIRYPVILKPLDASQGRGISTRVDDVEGLRRAWADAVGVSRQVVVETFAAGRDFRVLVVHGKVAAVAERIPAHVVGDGNSTIRQLIDRVNADPRRGVGHGRTLTCLPADALTEAHLARSGRTLESIPGEEEIVTLRAAANLSTGGTSIDRTDEIHPDNATACEMAANIIGLDIAGIDVVSPDISVPFRENDAVIIEVNAAPGIRMHTHPAEGRPRNVAAPIVDMLFPPGSEPTIPVIAVTGTNGKTTTTRLIAHLFRHTDRMVGFCTTDGVYLGNRLVMEGDMTGPFSANIILSNPAVDVAVLETARGGILRAGLGFDECDVGVVLNVSADHLGLRGIHTLEQLAEVKGVIAAVVRREGHAVLNGDDPLVRELRHRTAADVVFFSSAPDGENSLVEEHLNEGGIAVRVEESEFVIRRGKLRIPIATVREVPLMLGGAARFQRDNIMAAIATAYVRGVRYDDIRAGLLSFFPSPTMTPGRLNLVDVGGARVLVDYAHNPSAITGLIEFAMELPASRRVGVLGLPGDRRDDDIRQSTCAASRLDAVIIREDEDRRGRARGEIPALITAELKSSGMDARHIRTVFDEQEAVELALEELAAGELLVILATNVRRVLAPVRAHTLAQSGRP